MQVASGIKLRILNLDNRKLRQGMYDEFAEVGWKGGKGVVSSLSQLLTLLPWRVTLRAHLEAVNEDQ